MIVMNLMRPQLFDFENIYMLLGGNSNLSFDGASSFVDMPPLALSPSITVSLDEHVKEVSDHR